MYFDSIKQTRGGIMWLGKAGQGKINVGIVSRELIARKAGEGNM